jgi:hypothetical protein
MPAYRFEDLTPMPTARPRYSKEEFARRGDEIYDREIAPRRVPLATPGATGNASANCRLIVHHPAAARAILAAVGATGKGQIEQAPACGHHQANSSLERRVPLATPVRTAG